MSRAPHIPSHPPEPKMPKVAICIPSGDTVHKGFAMALAAMAYTSGPSAVLPAVPIALVGVEGSLIVRNRCECVSEAQKLAVDYMLFLDSDMQFPPYTLRRLLSHDKDIVGATYVQREEPHRLLGKWAADLQLTSDRVHEVEALPAGCLLIRMKVFDSMTRPYFRTPAHEAQGEDPAWFQGEDYYFCEVARKLGRSIWLDVGLSMQLGHIGRKVSTIAVQQAPNLEEASDGQAVH